MPKKTPMRMCTACRQMRPKKDLLRVVRTPEGVVALDETGRSNGRGAYLCRDSACLERALKTRAIERALEAKPGEATIDALRKACADETAER